MGEIIDYSKKEVPENYVCADCGATGCKLWREHNRFPKLTCAKHTSNVRIFYVPAIPADMDTDEIQYLNKHTIFKEANDWWHSLPTYPK